MSKEKSTLLGKSVEESLTDPLLQRLYRLFAVFSDNERHIGPEQAHFIIGKLFRLSGGTEQLQNSLLTLIKSDHIAFCDFLRMCDLLFPDRKQFEPLVDHVFERYVQQIISKGFLLYCNKSDKKHCLVGPNNSKWRAYWCTVAPGAIHLWPLHKSTNVGNRKTIPVDQTSAVQIGTFAEERFTWSLKAGSKQECLFGHFDELRRKHWMSAMKLAVEQRSSEELLEYDRKCSRSSECFAATDKNLSWRLALECENERLMQLLDDQRRALRDEEIVRTLAARMLDEERERREKLEQKLYNLERNYENQQQSSGELNAAGSTDGGMECPSGYPNMSPNSTTPVQ